MYTNDLIRSNSSLANQTLLLLNSESDKIWFLNFLTDIF
jgi:hypothetical protein